MNRYGFLLGAAVLITGCASVETETEEAIDLADVPSIVLEAAQAAAPGVVFTEAEIEVEGENTVYELKGEHEGETWEVEVTPQGKVLEVEQD